jgi:hypothetical protein
MHGVNIDILTKVLGLPELVQGESFTVRWTTDILGFTATITDQSGLPSEDLWQEKRFTVDADTDQHVQLGDLMERAVKDTYFAGVQKNNWRRLSPTLRSI